MNLAHLELGFLKRQPVAHKGSHVLSNDWSHNVNTRYDELRNEEAVVEQKLQIDSSLLEEGFS